MRNTTLIHPAIFSVEKQNSYKWHTYCSGRTQSSIERISKPVKILSEKGVA